MPRSHARNESREKQAMIPAPTFLSHNSRINCLCAHYEGILGCGNITPLVPKLSHRWRSASRNPLNRSMGRSTDSVDAVEKRKISFLLRIELQLSRCIIQPIRDLESVRSTIRHY